MAMATTFELRSPGINSVSGAGGLALLAGPKRLADRSLAKGATGSGAAAKGAEAVAGNPAGPRMPLAGAVGIVAGPEEAAWSQASYSVRVWGLSRQLLASASWPRICCAYAP